MGPSNLCFNQLPSDSGAAELLCMDADHSESLLAPTTSHWNVGVPLWLVMGLVAVGGRRSAVLGSGDLGSLLCHFQILWLWASQLASLCP